MSPDGRRRRTAILISGRGSNLQALIDAAAAPDYPAEIVLVLSNRPDAKGLARAETAGIATRVIPHRDHPTRVDFEAALTAALAEAGAELVCLAGFMRVLTAAFVDRWQGRLVNIHPSLLPAFPGLDTHARALAAGVKLHGCTVHLVSADVDEGPIIGQAAVPVLPGDGEADLAARVLAAEHRLYPLCLRLLAEDRVRIEAGRAVIRGPVDSGGMIMNPDQKRPG
ncbi:MAG: phosphoribosylglycinamide formyltransferase [Kiloniellales bacterium]|nr:phosphoribosylglycinamide formyltransferase [Kiloniellales bacterium]